MNEILEINGGIPLEGEVLISGAKNAALPLLMAALLTPEKCIFENVPNLHDVNITLNILEHFGAQVSFVNNRVETLLPEIKHDEASYSLVKALRASFWVLGPLLARHRRARVALPGGDIIGTRAVDIHLSALTQMGAEIKLKHGVVWAEAPRGLKPAQISFRFPSVGATHQILMAATLVPGETIISGAACEPEVTQLAEFLGMLGAQIEGAGTPEIIIHGSSQLKGASICLIGDRIEAGTYILAILSSGGQGLVRGIRPSDLGDFLEIVRNTGAILEERSDPLGAVFVKCQGAPQAISAITAPFPGFASDLQPQLMAYLTRCQGQSTIEETIYDGRFTHVTELARLGANIEIEGALARINGVSKLSGAPVEGFDIRGAASLVVAGLASEGVTQIHEIQHLRRGYEELETKLSKLGAKIFTRRHGAEDSLSTGC